MAHDVFISHAVEDKEVAEKVRGALEGAGLKCWIAPRDVPYGSDYEEAIMDAITASPLLVLILSKHSNASPHVKREIQNACAEGAGTEIIPFRIDDVAYSKALRYYLASVQWLDATTASPESRLAPLVEHVRARLRRTTGALPPPPRPEPEPVLSGTDGGRIFQGTGDGRTLQGTGDGRKPFPLAWLAGAAGLLLLVGGIAFLFVTRSSSGGNTTNTLANSNLATPVVNSNANLQSNSNTQKTATPTPTVMPSPSPSQTPTRGIPANLNLNRRRLSNHN